MNLDGFKELFSNSKNAMPLSQAAEYICRMRDNYPLMAKGLTFNRLEYNHRLAVNTACTELIDAMRSAAPWQDYREIIADYIWPYMQKVLKHRKDGRYNGPYGEKWGVADAWFVEMWLAYDEIFRRMPGNVPDITQWKMLNGLIHEADIATRKFRRKL